MPTSLPYLVTLLLGLSAACSAPSVTPAPTPAHAAPALVEAAPIEAAPQGPVARGVPVPAAAEEEPRVAQEAAATLPPEALEGLKGDSFGSPTPRPRASDRKAPLVVELGEGLPTYTIPSHEVLTYRAVVDLGILGEPRTGKVTLESGVEQVLSVLPKPGEESLAPPLEVGWIRSHAVGSAIGYELDHELLVRILPQDWPRLDYRDTQLGSSARKRTLKVGVVDGEPTSVYQRDRHCKGCKRREHFVEGWFFGKDRHCDDCDRAEHRVWRDADRREVPEGAIDMLSAVFLGRSMVQRGETETTFNLIDRDELWYVALRQGERRTIKTPAGKFEAVRMELVPQRPPGEDFDEKERFEGLFGIHGTIAIWLDAASGVPVLIAGSVPFGPFALEVRVELERFEGTPPDFAPR